VLAGCSVNDIGVTRTQSFVSNGALARHTTAYGLHLDARDGNASLTLGFFDSQRVYAAPCPLAPDVAAPVPVVAAGRDRLHLSYSRILGFQIAAGADEQSLTLGARSRLRAYPPGADQGGYRAIHFEPRAPMQTRLWLGSSEICK